MAWQQVNLSLATNTVSVVTFQSLGDWTQLWLSIIGLKHNDASTIQFGVQVGSAGSFLTSTGDYSRGGATGGTAYLQFCSSVPQNTETQADLFFYNFNKTIQKAVDINGGQTNNNTGLQSAMGVVKSVLVLDSLRVMNSTAVNFTAGDIRLYASIP